MIILLTNDDGIGSEGISTLRARLEEDHEVWTVAPDGERSGMSHAITLHGAVRIRRVGERSFSCVGTPADCILYSLLGAVDVSPDVIVSGINHGPNIGTDILYSGTVAAARQAALMNRPAVAVSLVEMDEPRNFDLAARFIAENLDLMVSLWHPDHLLNVNVPNVHGHRPRVRVTRPARRIYRDHLVDFSAPNGERFFFLQGTLNDAVIEEDSDWAAIRDSDISVSPIFLHPLNRSEDRAYHEAVFRQPDADGARSR
jgi:5'-nucleotidase